MDAEAQKASKVPVWKHWRFFPRAMLEVAKVMEFGSSKPGRKAGGWTEDSSVSDTYFEDAFVRHLIDEQVHGEYDSESKLLHLAHRACNAMMALEMEMRKREPTKLPVTKGSHPDGDGWGLSYLERATARANSNGSAYQCSMHIGEES